VKVNAAGSGSNALVSAGVYGADGYGDSIGTSTASASEFIVSGLTDAFGTLTFILKNSDLTGETRPATLTSPVPATNQRFSTVTPQIVGNPTIAKSLELHYASGLKMPGQLLGAPTNVSVSSEGLTVTVSWLNDPENQGLTRNEVYDSNDKLVCSTGETQYCSFTWDPASLQQTERYYVVPSTDTISGPASILSQEFTMNTAIPVLFGPVRNLAVGDSVTLLAMGFPANSIVYFRDGSQNIRYRTNANGSLTIGYEIWKLGITSLSVKVGLRAATLKLYAPKDKITSAICKVGKSIKVTYSGLMPSSTVELQLSDGRDALYATADEKGDATVAIDCLQVGGYIWTATVGSLSLNSGGFTVR
jgi:hypothetical protein